MNRVIWDASFERAESLRSKSANDVADTSLFRFFDTAYGCGSKKLVLVANEIVSSFHRISRPSLFQSRS